MKLVAMCVLLSAATFSCGQRVASCDLHRTGNDEIVQPTKKNIAYGVRMDDGGNIVTKTSQAKVVAVHNNEREGWDGSFLVLPILCSSGKSVVGWHLFGDPYTSGRYASSVIIANTELVELGEFCTHHGFPGGVQGSVDSSEILVFYKWTGFQDYTLLILGESGLVCVPVEGNISSYDAHFDSEIIVIKVSDQGLVLIDRSTGEASLIHADSENRIYWFGVYGDRIVICKYSEDETESEIAIYRFDGSGTSQIDKILNGLYFRKFDQFGKWALLLSQDMDYFIVNIDTGKIFKSDEYSKRDGNILLTDVTVMGDQMAVEIVESEGFEKPVTSRLRFYASY